MDEILGALLNYPGPLCKGNSDDSTYLTSFLNESVLGKNDLFQKFNTHEVVRRIFVAD